MSHVLELPSLIVGAALGATAVVVLLASPRSTPHRFFAAFLALVSANSVVNWLAWVFPVEGGANRFWFDVARPFLVLDPALLLYFASIYPRRTLLAERGWAPALLFAVVAALAAWVVADPQGARPAVSLYLVACYGGALALVAHHLGTARFPTTREDLRPLLAALVIVVVPRIGLLETDLGLFPFPTNVSPAPPGYPALVAAVATRLVLTGLALLAVLWAVRRAEGSAERARTRPWMLGASLVVIAVSTLWVPTALYGYVPALSGLLYSSRWLFFTALVAYAFARNAFLEADARPLLSRMGPTPLLAGLVAFLVLNVLLDGIPGHDAGELHAGSALAAAGGLVVGVAATFARPAVAPERARGDVGARKVAVYRGLLEAHLEAGGSLEDEGLEVQRRRLGVSAPEHRDLLALIGAERALEAARGPAGSLPPGFRLVRAFPSGPTAWTVLAERGGGDGLAVVKVLKPEWRRVERVRAAFLREGEVLARVRHRNVVPVLGSLQDPPTLLLDYAEGGSLAERVANAGPLRGEALVRLARDLLAGLWALHAAGVVHRDLKPENVLLRGDGTAMLGDMGVARDLAAQHTKLQVTAPGQEPGTVPYMAPEQVRGQPSDHRTDLYALGAVLCFAATGRHYLGAEGAPEFDVKRAIVDQEPWVPRELPARVRLLVSACLEKDPARRPRDGRAGLALLEGRRSRTGTRR